MEEIILQAMFWEQVQTTAIGASLMVASALYVSILPWTKEQIQRSNTSLLQSLASKENKQLLLKEVLLED